MSDHDGVEQMITMAWRAHSWTGLEYLQMTWWRMPMSTYWRKVPS